MELKIEMLSCITTCTSLVFIFYIKGSTRSQLDFKVHVWILYWYNIYHICAAVHVMQNTNGREMDREPSARSSWSLQIVAHPSLTCSYSSTNITLRKGDLAIKPTG